MDLNLRTTELRLGPPGSETDDLVGTFSDSGSGSDVGTGSSKNLNSSAAKAEAVGWPPIRSFRKNSMATTNPHRLKTSDDKVEEGGGSCVYVKVSMDGAPYLRKVDLNAYATYAHLSTALQSMFSCFTIIGAFSGDYGRVPGRDGLIMSGSRLDVNDDGSKPERCVLTYEDKDGDWMLVGDVPWHAHAAPRAMYKCQKDD